MRNALAGDLLDEMVADRANANPAFPALLSAAVRRRELLTDLTAKRESLGASTV